MWFVYLADDSDCQDLFSEKKKHTVGSPYLDFAYLE